MNYKKILKSQSLRLKILEFLKFIPDKMMIKLQYRLALGRRLDLENPKRFTEKLQWYKLYYRNPLVLKCADKYEVRNYVESKGLHDILNELYGVYEDVDQIDYNLLPNKFVVKTTKGSGTNMFVSEKNKLDINDANKQLVNWLNQNPIPAGREWSYRGAGEKIIIEKFINDESNEFHGINDYKFMCFNGEVKYIVFDVDRHSKHKRNFYDADWNLIDVSSDKPNINSTVSKPEGLEEMKRVASKLAEEFPFVRVDLYWINGKVVFGELTFYPWSGYVKFFPDKFDYIFGENLVLH